MSETSKASSRFSTALRWGLLGGLVSVVVSVLAMWLGWRGLPVVDTAESVIWYVQGAVVNAAFLILGLRAYRAGNGGYVSFGNAFGFGILLLLVIMICNAIYLYGYIELYLPDYEEQALAAVRKSFEAQGLGPEEVERQQPLLEAVTNREMFVVSGFLNALIGNAILALIGAAALKRDRPD